MASGAGNCCAGTPPAPLVPRAPADASRPCGATCAGAPGGSTVRHRKGGGDGRLAPLWGRSPRAASSPTASRHPRCAPGRPSSRVAVPAHPPRPAPRVGPRGRPRSGDPGVRMSGHTKSPMACSGLRSAADSLGSSAPRRFQTRPRVQHADRARFCLGPAPPHSGAATARRDAGRCRATASPRVSQGAERSRWPDMPQAARPRQGRGGAVGPPIAPGATPAAAETIREGSEGTETRGPAGAPLGPPDNAVPPEGSRPSRMAQKTAGPRRGGCRHRGGPAGAPPATPRRGIPRRASLIRRARCP